MKYTELVTQASVLSGLADFYSGSMDGTDADRAFTILKTSLLALNTDDRLTFAVDDIVLPLAKPKLVLTPDETYELEPDEQVFKTDYPVEIPPAYVMGDPHQRMRRVEYETLAVNPSLMYIYAMRIESGKATLHFRYGGRLGIGLKKPLDTPALITDEVKLTGSALNLLMYKLAKDICAFNGSEAPPEVNQKYTESLNRHAKIKSEILAPPVLEPCWGHSRRL